MMSEDSSSTATFSSMGVKVKFSEAGLWPVAFDALEKMLKINTKLAASPARDLVFMWDNLEGVIYETTLSSPISRLF